MKKLLKFGVIGITIVTVSVAGTFFLTKASISEVNGKDPQNISTGSGSTSVTDTNYNDLDAAAIIGALALARQTPLSAGKPLAEFVTNLTVAKIDPTKSTIDIAVKGNQLIDFSIASKGASDPICFVVKPPTIADGTPGQNQWVVYFAPKTKLKSELLLIQVDITTCEQANTFVENLTDADIVKISAESNAIAKTAALKIPSSVLTPIGLIMLDEARGLLNAVPATK